jgi:large subunit ribosomal protein L15
MAEELNLSNLKPASRRRSRKRLGRGLGSGKGRYSGRGIKGQKARAGSHKMRPGFEGGQMPVYMRLGKQRGATSADAMPIGPFRTSTVPVNVGDLEARFEAGDEVTPGLLAQKRIVRRKGIPVKILGNGDLTKKLTVSAHGFSATAREKIEAAGGTVAVIAVERGKQRGRAKGKETAETAAPKTEAGAKGTAHQPDAAVDEEPTGRQAVDEAVEDAQSSESGTSVEDSEE